MTHIGDAVTRERCIACDVPFKTGDKVLSDASGGLIHRSCCGPERESFTNSDGDPLGPNDPIPGGWSWEPDHAAMVHVSDDRLRQILDLLGPSSLPLTRLDTPDYAEVSGPSLQAMSTIPEALLCLNDVPSIVTELLARRHPSTDGGAVKVKDLEWINNKAITPFGKYRLYRTDDGWGLSFNDEELVHVGFNSVGALESPREKAMSYAQPQYRSAVLSSLQPVTADGWALEARRLLEKYEAARENQQGNGAEINLIIMANYGDLALQMLRSALPTAPGATS